jgi:hypothetical protein
MRARDQVVLGAVLAGAISAAGCEGPPRKTAPSAAPVETASAEAAEEASAAPSASASASASADAKAHGPPKPPRPTVKAIDPPEETKSPLPKLTEWTDVPRRAVVDKVQYDCTIQHVREWHRITCSCTNATVALIAGERNGVSLSASERSAQLFFPVRKGDARAFEVFPHSHTEIIQNAGPYGPGVFEQEGGPAIVISETWLEGEDHPTIVIQ